MKVNEELITLCEDIFKISGIYTVLYTADGHFLYSHPGTMSDFCLQVRQSAALIEKCLACDKTGLDQCRKSGNICIYRCHMGLYEAVTPIIDSGILIGYLLFGQRIPSDGRDTVHARIAAINDSDFRQKLTDALPSLTETDEDTIRAAARIMAMGACYIRLNHLLGVQKESLARHIEEYVEAHLQDPDLSLTRICRDLGISRSSLYNICRRSFSMGISDYIRARRLERAIDLIRTTSLPIHRISDLVGFSDSDYLTRSIRRATGKTPLRLRNS